MYTGFAVAQIFPVGSRNFPYVLVEVRLLAQKDRRHCGITRAIDFIAALWRTRMLDLGMEKIGELVIVDCRGRIVRSEAALNLSQVVTSLEDFQIIVLDLSGVSAIEDGGIGILLFLLHWARDHQIQIKVFNPRTSVRDRLELANWILPLPVASLEEILLLLAQFRKPLRRAAGAE